MGAAWANRAREAGCTVRDLYSLYPNGQIDVAAEQAACEEATRLVFQHPFHWYSAPWLMKKWLDEVLTFGWAYGGPDRLSGKEWLEAVSVGAPAHEYGPDSNRLYHVEDFLKPLQGTARFCRMEWVPPFIEFGAGLEEIDLETSCDRYIETIFSRR